MKKVLAGLILLVAALPILAQPHGEFRRGHWHRAPGGGWFWVPALIVGGVAGAVIARESQTPVIIEREPVTVPPTMVCSEWKEIQTSDGKIYRERSCKQQ
jgi:hypothetical protein